MKAALRGGLVQMCGNWPRPEAPSQPSESPSSPVVLLSPAALRGVLASGRFSHSRH
jgi:hypothetical protein